MPRQIANVAHFCLQNSATFTEFAVGNDDAVLDRCDVNELFGQNANRWPRHDGLHFIPRACDLLTDKFDVRIKFIVVSIHIVRHTLVQLDFLLIELMLSWMVILLDK